MASNKEAERNEKLFDAILTVALEESVNRDMEALPSQEELEEMFPRSEAMDKRVMEILDNSTQAKTNTSKGKKAFKIFTRIAASFAVLFTVVTITLMSVEASRNFILNTIIRIRNDYVHFEFRDSANIQQPSSYTNILEEILPIGFEYELSFHLDTVTIYRYSNEAGEYLALQRHLGETVEVGVSETNRVFSIMDIGNQTIYVFDAYIEGYCNLIMWAEGEYVYKIISSLDTDTLINIAENMIER